MKKQQDKYGDGRPRLQRDWDGWIVRLKRDMKNGSNTFPEGLEMKVSHASWKGVSLIGLKKCEVCGVGDRLHISAVDPRDIEFVREK